MKNSVLYLFVLVSFLYTITTSATTRSITTADSTTRKGTTYQNMEVTPNENAQALWDALCDYVPQGVNITSLSYNPPSNWYRNQSGLYRNIPPILSVQMKDGIIMTSGHAVNCLGPNEQEGMTQAHGGIMVDADISNAVNTDDISDIATLTIQFTSDNTIPGFSFIFCYGTDEFPEYVGSEFNDVFICIFDGQNVCFDSQGSLICVNNTFFNVDNNIQGPDAPLNLEYDGFTCVLQTSKVISPGSHSIKFAIADVGDNLLDAGVFLNSFRFDTTDTGTHPIINIIEPQQFDIAQNTSPQTVIGTIDKLTTYGPITLTTLNNVPEFYLNSWDIVVSDGVVFDPVVTPQYVIKVKATLDTLWLGKPWIMHDTADMTISIIDGDPLWPPIEQAVVYDQNGNGIGDSIYVKLKYNFPSEYTLEKADFSWPSGQIDYSENIDNNDLFNSNTIKFSYAPGGTAPVWTEGQSTISITIDSTGQSSTHSCDLEDGIGPVLTEAICVKRYKPMPDTLRLRISEPVDVTDITGNSFILVKKDHVKEIEIEPMSGTMLDLGNESYIQFLIEDLLADAPAPGDSVKILHTGPVIDKKDNRAHENNPPAPIEFVDGMLDPWPQITKAVIYDKNGNGIGDSVAVAFDANFIDSMTAKTAAFIWPENQNNYIVTITAGMMVNKTNIAFSYDPGTNAPVWTKGTSEITVTVDSMNTDISRKADLEDGIGPVLEEAKVVKRYKPNPDTFRVRLSEPVNVSAISGRSFILIKGNHIKEIEIEPLDDVIDLGGESYIKFLVVDLLADAPAPGDSLKILHTGPVIDKVNNKAHKDNPPVPIIFTDGSLDPWPEIKNAVVYDKNGNGIGDSVCLVFNGYFVDSMKTKTASFTWPENQFSYTETIDESDKYNDNTIAFSFTPDNASPVWTHGKSAITVTLDSLKTEISRTADLNDGIGPLLKEASVIKRYLPGNDTFFVKITEPVKVSDISGYSFTLIKENHVKAIDIAPIDPVTDLNNGDYIRFAVVDLDDDAPSTGDSLKILHTGSVIDLPGNKAHKDNPPVPLQFINSNVPVKNAYYYDLNGDGIVDNVRLVFVDTVKDIDNISFDVAFTSWQAYAEDVPAAFESNEQKCIVLDLRSTFDAPAKIIDKTYGEMSVTLTYTDPAGIVTYDVADKAAPVISKATYYLSRFFNRKRVEQDTLEVVFSENVNDITSIKPFWLERLTGEKYYLELHSVSKTANKVTFIVTEIVSNDLPTEGDSIWINNKEDVQDNLNNTQIVDNNKRVELIIDYPDFDLIPYVLGPEDPEEKALGIAPDLQISATINKGTVIILEPEIKVPIHILESVECGITIFDAVGNELASCNGYTDFNGILEMSPLEKGPNNMIVILWADKNANNRDVGKGSYCGQITITYNDGKPVYKKVIIPMKR